MGTENQAEGVSCYTKEDLTSGAPQLPAAISQEMPAKSLKGFMAAGNCGAPEVKSSLV